MVQQGQAVDDVLYFYGDEEPNFVRLKSDDPAHVLPGYNYDETDEDALLHSLTLRNGRFISPAGNAYRLVVMPQGRRLSLASLERVAEYVRQGGALAGEAPLGPTGNLRYADVKRFSQLVQEIWGGCGTAQHSVGTGTVFCSEDSRVAPAALHVVPDFADASGHLDYATALADRTVERRLAPRLCRAFNLGANRPMPASATSRAPRRITRCLQ